MYTYTQSECGGYHSVRTVEPSSADPDRKVTAVLAHHGLADAGNHHAQYLHCSRLGAASKSACRPINSCQLVWNNVSQITSFLSLGSSTYAVITSLRSLLYYFVPNIIPQRYEGLVKLPSHMTESSCGPWPRRPQDECNEQAPFAQSSYPKSMASSELYMRPIGFPTYDPRAPHRSLLHAVRRICTG